MTNVEWEHVDMFADEAAVAAAFDRFVARVRPGGALVVCGDDAGARALLDAAPSTVRLVTYGATQRERESGPGGLTREEETPLPSNSPHDHMILRVDLVDSHGSWKRPRLHTAHMTI